MNSLAKLKEIGKSVGNTPLIQIADKIYVKLETYNPSCSIKDRLIYYLLHSATNTGDLTEESHLLEATSGNTGISLALFGAVLGLETTLIMPCNMSEERKIMMRNYGAKILEVGPSDFSRAISLRDEMCQEDERFWTPNQFSNTKNIHCHMMTTAPEIHSQVGANWSAFVSGAGTGGTMMGVRRYLEKTSLNVSTVLMTPAESAQCHGIQGVNDGEDFLLNKQLMTEEIAVSTHDAIGRAMKLSRETGILAGISSGANVLAAERFVEQENPEGVVVTLICDRGERYMSIFKEYVPIQNWRPC